VLHFIKYNLIGVINTLITLVVVWILHQQLDWNLEISNFLGFVVGGVNSYVVNRLWNFKSTNEKRSEMIRFLVIFIFAYLLNLGVLEIVKATLAPGGTFVSFATIFTPYVKSGYIAHIIANVVYVIASFSLYKCWVFKERKVN
jgi:putative flippase GtrA